MRGALVLAGDVAAHQVAERIYGFIGDAVVDARASALSRNQAMTRQVREVARDVGGRVAAELSELADVSLATAQQVEDLQAGRFRQHLEIGSNLLQGFDRQAVHMPARGENVAIMPDGHDDQLLPFATCVLDYLLT
jgi:hypothetical protein